jgi:hypothetical protein
VCNELIWRKIYFCFDVYPRLAANLLYAAAEKKVFGEILFPPELRKHSIGKLRLKRDGGRLRPIKEL